MQIEISPVVPDRQLVAVALEATIYTYSDGALWYVDLERDEKWTLSESFHSLIDVMVSALHARPIYKGDKVTLTVQF